MVDSVNIQAETITKEPGQAYFEVLLLIAARGYLGRCPEIEDAVEEALAAELRSGSETAPCH